MMWVGFVGDLPLFVFWSCFVFVFWDVGLHAGIFDLICCFVKFCCELLG